MRFFRVPEFPGPGFRIGIFNFGLDRRVPKSRGSEFENPEKIPSEKPRKSRNSGKILVLSGILINGMFSGF